MGTLGGAGSAGLSDLIDISFATTSDGSIPGQANNDQPTVETLLKQRMKESQGWGSAHQAGFGGLPEGMPLVIGILAKLAEQITGLPVTTWITMWTENPIIDTLSTIAQDALASIFTVNVNLQSIWEGLNFLDPDFDPQAAWDLISDLIEGLVPDWLEVMIFGAEGTEFPLTFPHGFAPPPNLISQFFYILRKFTGIDDFDDLFSPTLPFDIIFNFIEAILKPQDLLAWLVDGILPDGQAPQLIHDIIDAIIKGFAGIPIIGPVVQGVWDVIADLLGIGTDAQTTGTTNAAEIAAIKAGLAGIGSGGLSIIDDFDRIVATNLGAGWTQTYAGPGGGTEGIDGTGYCHWSTSGGSYRAVINLNATELETNTQYASFVLKTKLADSPFLGQAKRSLILRSNAAHTDYLKMELTSSTTATLSAVVGGSVVASVNSTGLVTKPGDLWEFFAGDATDDYHLYAKLNGKTVLDLVDSGHLSVVDDTPGTGNLKVGFGGQAGVTSNLIIFLIQYAPPDVAAFGAADNTG